MKASDNPFPSILVEEATEPSAPAAGHQRLYIDSTSHKLKRTDSSGTDVTVEGGVGTKSSIVFVIDGGGATIATGVKGDVQVPYAGTISAVRLLADQSGSIVVDIWKDTYANYPPTDADTITSATPPTISSATKAEDTTLSGWTTSITAGNILRFNVDSCTSIQRCSVVVEVTRT